MVEFAHSIVLFSGDDGLPLEFNVRNTNEKSLLKAMIEYGGGVCTTGDNAVHLISPGTKVLNADLGKKLVSSRYVFDCVDQNCLLEVNDYVFTINEAQCSDISDEDSGRGLGVGKADVSIEKEADFISNLATDMSITYDRTKNIDSSLSTPSKLGSGMKSMTSSGNQSESFVEGSQDTTRHPKITNAVVAQICDYIPLTSTAKEPESMDMDNNYDDLENDLSPIQASASLVTPQVVQSQYQEMRSPKKVPGSLAQKESHFPDVFPEETDFRGAKGLFQSPRREIETHQMSPQKNDQFELRIGNDVVFDVSPRKENVTFPHYERINDNEDSSESSVPVLASPVHTAVSSSQQAMGELDQFDNLLLSKAQQKTPVDDDDNLSQSYTVSSSADAQKPNSVEMFAAGPSTQVPDSPTQTEDQSDDTSLYIKRLEAEVEKILLKPSPKSIQDKICLVKYLCCVKKLSPASVLQSLQQL